MDLWAKDRKKWKSLEEADKLLRNNPLPMFKIINFTHLKWNVKLNSYNNKDFLLNFYFLNKKCANGSLIEAGSFRSIPGTSFHFQLLSSTISTLKCVKVFYMDNLGSFASDLTNICCITYLTCVGGESWWTYKKMSNTFVILC